MKLHMVNGFLGSGKTTAIIAATRSYLQQGKKVAIVTNDKGRYQVDTAFFQTAHIPTAQVAGGCFRCSFDEFKDQVASLFQAASPDILFAESVGSCVDLVNTVFPPLRSVPGIALEASTYSVFTDLRLFRRWLAGQPLPFSDSIVYTYGKQIDETQLLVLNKMDLLSPDERETVLREAQLRFPEKHILLQNSLAGTEELPWNWYLDHWSVIPSMPGFQVDYSQYMDAEKKMAWLDRVLLIHPAGNSPSRRGVVAIIANLIQVLREQSVPVAHIKFFVSDSHESCKLSFTAMDIVPGDRKEEWQAEIPDQLTGSVKMMINARLEMKSEAFRALTDHVINNVCTSEGVKIEAVGGIAYHPRVMPAKH